MSSKKNAKKTSAAALLAMTAAAEATTVEAQPELVAAEAQPELVAAEAQPEPAAEAQPEPVAEAQPVAAQPVAAQPVAAQPVAAQPVAAQPVAATPAKSGKRGFSLEAFAAKATELIPGLSESAVVAMCKLENVTVQGAAASVLVRLCLVGDQKLGLTADKLTEILRAGFPSADIGHRHGPHYLSHARKGRLPGLTGPIQITHSARKPRAVGELPPPPVQAASQPVVSAQPTTPMAVQPEQQILHVTAKDVDSMDRLAVQSELKRRGLPTGGNLEALRTRLETAIRESNVALGQA